MPTSPSLAHATVPFARRRGLALLVVVGVCLVPTVPGCSCPGTMVPGEPDAGEGDAGAAPDDCVLIEVGDITLDVQQDVQTIYSAPLTTNIGGGVPDYLVFNFVNYNERFGVAGAGTFSLAEAPNDNRGTCPECVSVFQDQLTETSVPEAVFFQRAGSITLDVNPRTQVLEGSLEGLVLEEVTIDGATLTSTPVPGGRCLRLADLALDYRFVPPAWTCDPALYQSGGECNCDCGAPDPDCSCDPFANPDCPAVIEDDCADGTACTVNGCLAVCDPFSAPTVPCGVGQLCVFDGTAGPVCIDDGDERLNGAALGETCQGLDLLIEYCAVDGTVPAGVCDDLTGVCRPVCGPGPAGCPDGERCYTIAGGGPGEGYGFCLPDDQWTCDPDSFDDGAFCDCNCGGVDPDCADDTLPIFGCAEDERCVEGACQAP
jgi:hypothetical protein